MFTAQELDRIIDVVARRRYERHYPSSRAGDWHWLPAQSKRQWLEETREDLEIALGLRQEVARG